MQTVPFIPDNAPFTPEQRNWLNGFLAGLFSQTIAAAPALEPSHSLKIVVLYASQSGTAEGLARKLVKELNGKGHVASLNSLEGYTPAALFAERYAIIIASTYGEGEPPESAKPFYDQLCLQHFPCAENLTYAVLALGDRSYEHFCRFGVELDKRLASLAGTRLCERVDCDVDLDESVAAWKGILYQSLDGLANPKSGQARVSASAVGSALPVKKDGPPAPSRENPYLASLIEKRPLTSEISSKQTLHIAFDIRDSPMSYEAGDACGVIAQNDPSLVEELLHTLKFEGAVDVQLPRDGATPLRHALLQHLQITRLSRRMVEAYATIGNCRLLFDLLSPSQLTNFEAYTYDRGLIDLLHDYPGILREPADLVAMLPRLSPRLYSISSSPAAHAGQIHTTVAVVRYQSNNRQRGGVCSTLLADRRQTGESLPVYIQANKRFRLPADQEAPMIMIGPGTGIAPFRSFLHERRALQHGGRNWLFFGERSAATDFLYRDELEAMHKDGHLSRLDLAFSRDQERKIYVQDRMREQGAAFFRWLEDGATVYVCGDASRMAKDVDSALHEIVRDHGSMTADAASEYVAELKDQNRYHRDVY
ncbi:MAG: sulfite reductase subunit alpha [Edaphobacter sp.]|uniref:sulfite reductase subunit alpha n=1 Tax=Edaphobacter sp. TaxID=1934404 RepID=UPI0023831922|nr:sulfite reductase subunit alpha [Edaphobacter sp.]MDE1177940.1 sulfite reductase subunit alpha [Edaphobacter sp.]